jgi:hypothetical protein
MDTVMEFRKAILKVAFFAREIYFLKAQDNFSHRGLVQSMTILSFSGAKPLAILSLYYSVFSHSRAKA